MKFRPATPPLILPDLRDGPALVVSAAAADGGEALGAAGLFEEVLFGEILMRLEQALLLRGGGVDAEELGGIRGVVQEELLLRGGGVRGEEEVLLRGGVALDEQVLLGGDGGLLEEGCLVVAARGPRGLGWLGRGRHRERARGEADYQGAAEEGGKRMPFHDIGSKRPAQADGNGFLKRAAP